MAALGEAVIPAEAARPAGLEQGSDRYDAALSLLLGEGALVEDERYQGIAGAGEHSVVAYVLAEGALDLLQE